MHLPDLLHSAKGLTCSPLSLQALTDLAKQKPSCAQLEALAFLGTWLLQNNPNKPLVQPPGAQLAHVGTADDEAELRDALSMRGLCTAATAQSGTLLVATAGC